MEIEHDVVADLCVRNDISRLRVFGSAARGEASDESDIDLIADFSAPKSLIDIVRIERELSQRLGRKVDLLTENALSPHIRKSALRDARVVYERAA